MLCVHCLDKANGDCFLTLPEREEDDALDRAELEHRVEGGQHLPRGAQKQEQPVQGEAHRHVVDDGDVDVAAIGAPVTIVVMPGSLKLYKVRLFQGPEVVHHNNDENLPYSCATYLQEDDDKGAHGLDEAELQRGLLAEAQHPDGVGGAGQAAPRGTANRTPPQRRHDVALPAQVLVAQRQEVVDHKSCKITTNIIYNLYGYITKLNSDKQGRLSIRPTGQ